MRKLVYSAVIIILLLLIISVNYSKADSINVPAECEVESITPSITITNNKEFLLVTVNCKMNSGLNKLFLARRSNSNLPKYIEIIKDHTLHNEAIYTSDVIVQM